MNKYNTEKPIKAVDSVDQGESGGAGSKPKNYALLSVIGVLSFIPLGLVSQYYAFKVDGLYYQGEVVKAMKASKKALVYGVLAITMGFIITGLLVAGVVWLVITLYETITTIGSAGLMLNILQDFIPGVSVDSPILDSELGNGSVFEYSPENVQELEDLLNQLNQ